MYHAQLVFMFCFLRMCAPSFPVLLQWAVARTGSIDFVLYAPDASPVAFRCYVCYRPIGFVSCVLGLPTGCDLRACACQMQCDPFIISSHVPTPLNTSIHV